MQLEDLIEQLKRIAAVHPYAVVKVGIPDDGVQGDSVVEITEVHYEALTKRVVIEL